MAEPSLDGPIPEAMTMSETKPSMHRLSDPSWLHATSQQDQVYEFAGYRLECGRALTCVGVAIALAPKELAVLQALVQREGKLVTKAQLLAEVWPDEAVTEDSLTRCIYVLRQRLAGDHKVSIIATVHRRGYRICAPVTRPRLGVGSVTQRSVRTSATAFTAYLEGWHCSRLYTLEGHRQALQFFDNALQLDPTYATAWAAIADCRIYQAMRRAIEPRHALQLVRDACERALALEPDLASAHAAMGFVQGAMLRNGARGLALLDRALSLDPQCAQAYHYRAWVLEGLGRHEQSISDCRTACLLDPYSPYYEINLGCSLFIARRFEDALATTLRTVTSARTPERSRAVANTYRCGMAAYVGDFDTAATAGAAAVALSRRDPSLLTSVAYGMAQAGDAAGADQLLYEITHREGASLVHSLVPAAYLALGEWRIATRWVEQAADEHCPWLLKMLRDPRLEGLNAELSADLQD